MAQPAVLPQGQAAYNPAAPVLPAVVAPWNATRYVFLQQISAAPGLQGSVDICRDTQQNNRLCVVKRVPKAFIQQHVQQQGGNGASHLVEVEVAHTRHMSGTLGDRRFAEVYEYCDDATNYYIVFEYAAQSDFFNIFVQQQAQRQPQQQPNLALIAQYMHQTLGALDRLHGAGIAHLDVSLENVVVRADNSCALISLERSIQLTPLPAGGFAPITGVHGKHRYRAPETWQPGATYQAMPCDVFEAGVTLLFMVAVPLGHTYPWDSTNPNDPRFRLLMTPGQGLPALLQGLGIAHIFPPPLLDLLQRMLDPNPQQRPTAAECMQHQFFA